ncbi:MAG: hypothetical protein GY859_12895 [Desulfobacterales bacterium]|nr:hypothetical protein [Desulfobacterales bacterium]
MFSFIKKKPVKLPPLRQFRIGAYPIKFSLDRLSPGVDNIRYDVRLSPMFLEATSKFILQLLARRTNTEKIMGMEEKSVWVRRLEEFEWFYSDVMLGAVHKAKLSEELNIDFLARAASVKLLIDEIRGRHEELIRRFREYQQEYESTHGRDLSGIVQIKEDLSAIRSNRKTILSDVGNELFKYLADVQRKDLKELREINFGPEADLKEEFFTNPMLHVENPFDDFFMMETYGLVGRHHETRDLYTEVLSLLKILLRAIDTEKEEPIPDLETLEASAAEESDKKENAPDMAPEKATDQELEGWIKQIENVDILLDYFQTGERCRAIQRRKGDDAILQDLKTRLKNQKKMLLFFFNAFQGRGLMDIILAAHELKAVYLDYCPPLAPSQVLEYLIDSRKRKAIFHQLDRVKGFYGKTYSMEPLKKIVRRLKTISTERKKRRLIKFLKGFIRFHRDLENFKLLKKGMDKINLVSEEKIINLSRANHTLYEFLLPQENVQEEKPISNHVIIKADVRGSTEITSLMKERFLNPASYFSLNLFDPITDILPEFGATKVFLEGDAVILTIFEREDTPEGMYSVALACGMAIKILRIIQQYNAESTDKQLPNLELGIGVCYHDSAPTFLFDGENRIMISPAINTADRLSGCTKALRNVMPENRSIFNIFVYHVARNGALAYPNDGLVRYNVNGIELNADGLEKLSKEINLRVLDLALTDDPKKRTKIYTGKFPTSSGKYQRLVIREAHIPEVDPSDLHIIRTTPRKYYEVCTHPTIYDIVRKKLAR